MNILAIGAHPDDVEINCAGTLAKYIQQNHTVTIVHACTGDKGDYTTNPEVLSRIRIQESKQAGALLGAEVICLGFGDGEVFYSEQNLGTFVDCIRKVNPDVLITHNPDDYHLDHVAVSKMVTDASFLVSVPSIRPQSKYMQAVPQVYFMETYCGMGFVPMEYVDISDTFDIKLDMMGCHQSQVKWMQEHDHLDILDVIEVNAKYRGYQCGVQYAEGFIRYNTALRAIPKRFLP